MNNTAVVPRLVTGQATFLFEQYQPKSWKAAGKRHRDGQANDPSADDHEVIAFGRHTMKSG